MDRRTFLRRTVPVGAGVASAGCSAPFPDGANARALLGVFPGATSVATFERWTDTRHPVVTTYVAANDTRAAIDRFVESLTPLWEQGHVPMISWEPYLGSRESTPADIERRIRDGEYDRFVERWADALAAWLRGDADRQAYFRPMPEMNGGWLPWSAPAGGAGAFVGAWRRVHDAFADAGVPADRLGWVWNPNASGTSGAETEAYYPGDAYVDWVGIDGYNFGNARPWSTWYEPREVFEPMLSRLRAMTNAPVGVPEFGSTSYRNGAYRPQAKAAWIRKAFEFFAAEDVRMACWFNVDKETDWAVLGGTRGTHTARVRGERYPAYRRYRRATDADRFAFPDAEGGSGNGSVLSEAAFRGRI